MKNLDTLRINICTIMVTYSSPHKIELLKPFLSIRALRDFEVKADFEVMGTWVNSVCCDDIAPALPPRRINLEGTDGVIERSVKGGKGWE